MLNKVQLIGRLGRDPEFRATANQKSVASFPLATTERYKKENFTEWHRIVAWEALAEVCEKHLKKGDLVYVEGRLKTRQWEKDGEKRPVTEVVISGVRFLEPKTRDLDDNADTGNGSIPF